MNLDTAIISILKFHDRMYVTVPILAEGVATVMDRPVTPQEVQDRMHALDDAGRVLMRNGFYRLSEAERART